MCWFCLGCLMTGKQSTTLSAIYQKDQCQLHDPLSSETFNSSLLSAELGPSRISINSSYVTFPVSSSITNLGGGGASLGENFEIYSFTPLPVHTLCFLLAFGDASSQLPVHATLPATSNHTSLPGLTLVPLEA